MSEDGRAPADSLPVPMDGATADPFDTAPPEEQVELRALEQALRLAGEQAGPDGGFRLIFARCNVRAYREQLISRLQADLSSLRIQTIHFDRPITHLLDELHRRLRDPLPDPRSTRRLTVNSCLLDGISSDFPPRRALRLLLQTCGSQAS